jgi:hypothetical protein
MRLRNDRVVAQNRAIMTTLVVAFTCATITIVAFFATRTYENLRAYEIARHYDTRASCDRAM